MSRTAFIDANVPIYAAGRPHALKAACVEILRLAAVSPDAFVTDAEVLQELLHRYLARDLRTAGLRVLDAFADLMRDRIVPVTGADGLAARELGDRAAGVSTRGLVHAAVMDRVACTQVVSPDPDFDRLPGLRRLDPAAVPAWRDEVLT